jgi:GGDEF domain-containing protein
MARLWGNIVSMLGIGGSSASTAAAAAPAEAVPAKPLLLQSEPDAIENFAVSADRTSALESHARLEFGQRLSTLASYGSAISAGRVKLMNLEELKREFGPRWSHVSERVAVTISSVLKTRLGPSDAFIRLDEAHFVLLFGTHDSERAAAVCSLVAAEIKQKLFGVERDLAAVKLTTAVIQVDGSVTLDPIDPLVTLTKLLDAAPAVTEHRAAIEEPALKSKPDPDWREVHMPCRSKSARAH